MFNHPFTAVNFAVFPHRGVLGGGTARRSLAAMAAKTGCRWVILTPAGVQTTPYSEEIDYRSAATPTDAELCAASALHAALGWRSHSSLPSTAPTAYGGRASVF